MKKPLKDYWYPRTPSRWQSKTMDLCPYQDGLYLRLVDHYMLTKQPLPDSDNALARICGISPSEFTPHAAIIRSFFNAENGRLFQTTCDEILEDQGMLKHAYKKRASKAAKKRWEIHSEKPLENQKDKCLGDATSNAKGMLGDATEQNRTEDNRTEEIDNLIVNNYNNPIRETAQAANAAPTPAVPKNFEKGGSRLPDDWKLSNEWGNWALEYCIEKGYENTQSAREFIGEQGGVFRRYWQGKTGKDATKRDWRGTWENWIIRGLPKHLENLKRMEKLNERPTYKR